MLLTNAAVSALLNLLLLFGVPFLCYFAWHRWRHKQGLAEVARRAGLQCGETRYVWYSLAFAAVSVVLLLLWSPSVDIFLRAGSPQRVFRGLGVSGLSVTLALLYGVVKTGFAEEFLFRGLLAGSLSRPQPMMPSPSDELAPEPNAVADGAINNPAPAAADVLTKLRRETDYAEVKFAFSFIAKSSQRLSC